eukprot:jgi/Bigna1/139899/aug1.53_g14607
MPFENGGKEPDVVERIPKPMHFEEKNRMDESSAEASDKLDASSPVPATVVMRLILQSADVGKIIGPKGETIERFKQKTGSNISFSTYQPSMPRVAKIAGPINGVVHAIMLISDKIASDDAKESGGREENKKKEEEEEEDEEDGKKHLSAVLVVPFPHVGRIIGKRGQRIKKLREDTGTTISIVANNVTLTGEYKRLESAVMKLTGLLQEVSKRNPVSYAFPFENSAQQGGSQGVLANQAALQYHMVQLAPDTMQVLIPSSSAGVVIGRGGSTIQRLKTESGASISLSNYVKGAENRVATISGTAAAMAKAILALAVQIATDGGSLSENNAKEALSIVLLVPPQELGAIIGKKGARITELRNSTGASINVADEGSVTIQGNTAATSEAITKIAFLLYETRNKPSSTPNSSMMMMMASDLTAAAAATTTTTTNGSGSRSGNGVDHDNNNDDDDDSEHKDRKKAVTASSSSSLSGFAVASNASAAPLPPPAPPAAGAAGGGNKGGDSRVVVATSTVLLLFPNNNNIIVFVLTPHR